MFLNNDTISTWNYKLKSSSFNNILLKHEDYINKNYNTIILLVEKGISELNSNEINEKWDDLCTQYFYSRVITNSNLPIVYNHESYLGQYVIHKEDYIKFINIFSKYLVSYSTNNFDKYMDVMSNYSGVVGFDFNTKKDRLEYVNYIITLISNNGRRFFRYKDRVSFIEMDDRGRLWYNYAYNKDRIYLHYERFKFHEGGTLRQLIIAFKEFIQTGKKLSYSHFFAPKWIQEGDPWGYGSDMKIIQEKLLHSGILEYGSDKSKKLISWHLFEKGLETV